MIKRPEGLSKGQFTQWICSIINIASLEIDLTLPSKVKLALTYKSTTPI